MSSVTLPPPDSPVDHIDPDSLYEVVEGVIVEPPPMSALSNLIKSLLIIELGQFIKTNGLGRAVSETLFILDAEHDLRRRPDVAFVSKERWPLGREVNWEGDWAVIPELCIEVTSPHDLYDDVTRKVREYFAHGVRQVWVVWPPEKEVHVYRSREQMSILSVADTLSGDDILPGFALPVVEVFGG